MAITFRLPPGKLPACARPGPPPQPLARAMRQPVVRQPVVRQPVDLLHLLSFEIRAMIYEYILEDETPVGNFGKWNTRAKKKALRRTKLYSLLLVNRQCHQEFAPLLYQKSHFTFHRGWKPQTSWYNWYLASFWPVCQCLRETLEQCSLKFQLEWRRVFFNEKKWVAMTEELTKFLLGLKRLRTLYVYIDHTPREPMLLCYPELANKRSDVRQQQKDIGNALRRAFRFNPAIIELNIAEKRAPSQGRKGCRITTIMVQPDSDGEVAKDGSGEVREEDWVVYGKDHISKCEMECLCDEDNWVFKNWKLVDGRELLKDYCWLHSMA